MMIRKLPLGGGGESVLYSARSSSQNGVKTCSRVDYENNFPSMLRGLQQLVTSKFLNGDAYGDGLWVGSVARAFALGAPFYEFTHRIL